MKARGLSIVNVSDEAVRQWLEVVESAYPRVRENLVPPEIFDRVRTLRDEHRSTEANQP